MKKIIKIEYEYIDRWLRCDLEFWRWYIYIYVKCNRIYIDLYGIIMI